MEKTSPHRKQFSADISVEPGERAFVATITSAVTDRDREVLLPEGMRSKEFEQNPVIFWNHDYSLPPIGKAVSLKRESNSWKAKAVLAERPESHPEAAEWFPDTVHALMQQGVIRGVSVGFDDTVTWRKPTPKDVQQFGERVERVATTWDLLEFSVAPLMANQEALISAVSKGTLTAPAAKSMFGLEVPKSKPRIVVPVLIAPRRPARKRITEADIDRLVLKQIARQAGKLYI